MGQMIDGQWQTGWYDPDAKGAFQRPATRFRGRIAPDGPHPMEAGRYHLYVSYACPWAHRTLIVRALRGLEQAIGVSVVDPHTGDDGWVFTAERPDAIFRSSALWQIYKRADERYSGRVTVPVLWDKQTGTIVNNESREVMRMMDTAMEAFCRKGPTLAPPELVPEIDRMLDAIYEPINNGVYRAGFATKQGAYEEACRELFAALARCEEVLGRQPYLCGNVLTEADVALFTTLLRFDLVYYAHFKCNLQRIAEMPNLSRFLRELHARPEIAETCRLEEIKTHYYWSQTTVNPYRIVPLGPRVELG